MRPARRIEIENGRIDIFIAPRGIHMQMADNAAFVMISIDLDNC